MIVNDDPTSEVNQPKYFGSVNRLILDPNPEIYLSIDKCQNFRLSCLTMNSRKKNFRDVLDPFKIGEGWFIIDFSTFMIHPNPALPAPIKKQVNDTIKRLKLNTDELCVAARREWFECFSTGCMNFKLLNERAPFIAYEARRQGLA